MYNTQIKSLIYAIGTSEGLSHKKSRQRWSSLSGGVRKDIVRQWKDRGLLEGMVKIEKELKVAP